MEFELPEQEPIERTIARDCLAYAKQTQGELLRLHRLGYDQLWKDSNGELRSVVQMNAIFDEMDAVQMGQSGLLFQQAWELAEAIITVGITSDPSQFLPPYQYTIDPQTGHVTVS